jgi:hypothetical protein
VRARSKERPRSGAAGPRGRVRSQNAPLKLNCQTCLSPAVYDGTQHVGYAIAVANTFAAYDVAGRHLGNYPSQVAAMRAIAPVVVRS